MVPRVCAAFVVLLVVSILAFGDSRLSAAQDATPEAHSAASAMTTDVRYVLPFTPDGLSPNFTVAETVEGRCGEASLIAHDRPDAWDCLTTDNSILDPCIENPFVSPEEPGQLACLASPFDTDVVMVTLTEPLVRDKGDGGAPGGADMPESAEAAIDADDLPWGLELANGDRCALLRGTLFVMAGQVVHYGCADGGLVLGETIRNQPLWTVNYLAEGSANSSRVPVVAAWN